MVKVVASVVRFPLERGRFPVALSVLLQGIALLALVTVVRDERPDPKTDPTAWNDMGLTVEFTSIASPAILFTLVAFAGFYALDPSMSTFHRARVSRAMARWFSIGVALVETQLIFYGFWKGIWEMFGSLAAIAFLDFVLVFLVFRYLDSETANDGRTAPTQRTG